VLVVVALAPGGLAESDKLQKAVEVLVVVALAPQHALAVAWRCQAAVEALEVLEVLEVLVAVVLAPRLMAPPLPLLRFWESCFSSADVAHTPREDPDRARAAVGAEVPAAAHQTRSVGRPRRCPYPWPHCRSLNWLSKVPSASDVCYGHRKIVEVLTPVALASRRCPCLRPHCVQTLHRWHLQPLLL